MLEIEGLSKSYKNIKSIDNVFYALHDVNLKMEENAIYSIVGESGSGKSTLSKIITGIITQDKGIVKFNDKVINKKNIKQIRSQIQLVMQDGKSSLDPCQSVYSSIVEPLHNFKIKNTNEKEYVNKILKDLELENNILKKKPDDLSGGQQKRVCIARALAANPKVIIFDETLSGLDVIVKKNIINMLMKIQKEKKLTYIFITHDMDVALYVSDQIIVMENGKIVESSKKINNNFTFKEDYSLKLIKSIS